MSRVTEHYVFIKISADVVIEPQINLEVLFRNEITECRCSDVLNYATDFYFVSTFRVFVVVFFFIRDPVGWRLYFKLMV